jgi:hypothetical protein
MARQRHPSKYTRRGPGDDRVVLLDVDGVVADMSTFEHELARPAAARWPAFFSHLADAEVIASGFDLAWAVEGLGFTLVYSTTRPDHTHTGTRAWLTDHDLPAGRALLCRPHTMAWSSTAAEVKRSHCRLVRRQHPRWLRGFVADEAGIVDELAGEGLPALLAADLAGLGSRALGQVFDGTEQAPTAAHHHTSIASNSA